MMNASNKVIIVVAELEVDLQKKIDQALAELGNNWQVVSANSSVARSSGWTTFITTLLVQSVE